MGKRIWYGGLITDSTTEELWRVPYGYRKFIAFSKVAVLIVGPSQSSVKWEERILCVESQSSGDKADHSPPPSAAVKNDWRDKGACFI